MRLQHWLSAIICLLASVNTSAWATPPIPPSFPPQAGNVRPASYAERTGMKNRGYVTPVTHHSSPNYSTANNSVMPTGGTPNGIAPITTAPAHFSAVLPAGGHGMGVPPGMSPHPGISPFDHRYSQHINENGQWFHDFNSRPRKYYGGIAAMRFRLQNPEHAFIGDKNFAALAAVPPITIGTTSGAGHHVLRDNTNTEGIRIHAGLIDPDDTGWEATVWWASDVTNQFKLGQDTTPGLVIAAPSIPVSIGGGAGASLQFNQLFRLKYVQEAANAQVDRLFKPIWQSGSIKVRPIGGLRYTYIREGLHFSGIDGGPPIFTGSLNTNIRSHLVGPQIGFQAAVGGNNLRVISGTRFMLFANMERLHLEGSNFGTAAQVALGGVNSFSQVIRNTHLSPGFEQTLHVEANLLQHIPYLNTFDLMKRAKFRMGVTYFSVAEIARPGRSVRYRGLPQTPELITDRSKWSFISWDFGLHFTY